MTQPDSSDQWPIGAPVRANLFRAERKSGWVRLRTLIVLRWIAIAGQLGAVVVAERLFGLGLATGLCMITIGLLVIANLIAHVVYPENKLLSERGAFAALGFDLGQLALLLFLTGGLNNPFAVLILAPVVISASALSLRPTLVIGVAAILAVSAMAFVHVPVQTPQGNDLVMPGIFVFGFWVSIVIAVIFLGLYERRISSEILSMSQALMAAQMALAREQKLTDLGGVVAAAAHELGTPLATIKLTSSELIEELSDNDVLREDAVLIREQADRCRDILRSMGRAGKDDMHIRRAPIEAVIREAAEPHLDRGKTIEITLVEHDRPQPQILRRPEVIHGLRNLIQNAVDFASSTVWITVLWGEEVITIRIIDDGLGYAPQVIGRIGDPFMRRRKSKEEKAARPEYEGMGLGLFIAKTLLERTGAELTFANGSAHYTGVAQPGRKSGAIVEVNWRRWDGGIEPLPGATQLGENLPIAP